jgi:hypothetical protein
VLVQWPNRLRRNTIFARWFNVIGRFKRVFENISLFQKTKSGVWSAHPATTRGYRDRHGRRQRDAMDAGHFTGRVLLPQTAKARGPDPPTLTRRLDQVLQDVLQGDGGYTARYTGESARIGR